jgi:stage II sporulation protein D
MRVLLYKGPGPVAISCDGECRLSCAALPEGGMDLPVLVATVQAGENGLGLGSTTLAAREITLSPKAANMVALDRARYPGAIRATMLDDGSLIVVNLVDMETYLGGVVASEMPQSWPLQAVKSQVIAARTYALYKKKVRKDLPYDLESTTMDQVYQGRVAPSETLKAALAETRGVIMLHQEGLFPAYFHSTCGGHTVCAAVGLASSEAPFVPSVECTGCARSPHYTWTREITRQQLCECLQRAGVDVGADLTLQLKIADDVGTVRSVAITSGGRTVEVTGDKFQAAFGPKPLKSKRFTLTQAGDKVILRGKGWGHGVGLCQWGSRGLAAGGQRYDQILSHYYGGVELARFY